MKKILLVLAVALIAFGQTLLMYFWQDDSALIFKLQHPEGPAGSFGPGIVGDGAYKYLVAHYIAFFPFFRMEPFWYFLVGLLSFLVVVACFYFFTKELFKKVEVSYASTLLFASGYVGSEIMFRVINSWQTNTGLILALISLTLFLKFLKDSNKFHLYILSIAFFWACSEFEYVRSHSLIFVVLSLDLLLGLMPFRLAKIKGFLLRQIPYFTIFYSYYIKGIPSETTGFTATLSKILGGRVELLSGFFATIGNGLVPNVYQDKIIDLLPRGYGLFVLIIFGILIFLVLAFYRVDIKARIGALGLLVLGYEVNKYFYLKNLYWYNTAQSFMSGEIGILASLSIVIFGISLWKARSDLGRMVLFGYLFYASQIFGYFVKYPEAILATTHRYLSYASLGYAILVGVLSCSLFLRESKRVWLFPLVAIVLSNLILGFSYQRRIVFERSVPTRNFYKELISLIPKVEKGSVFYFDIKDDSLSQQQFRDFFSVGSMPESTALAIYYGVDRYDITYVTDSLEFLSKLAREDDSLDRTFSFFYSSETGLVDTTAETRKLFGQKSELGILTPSGNQGNSVALKGDDSPVNVPTLLSFDLLVTPDYGEIPNASSARVEIQKEVLDRKFLILDYLRGKKDYYKDVTAKSLSEWKYQEVENAIDNDLSTSWRGHRIYWHDRENEVLEVDLGKEIEISSVVWVNLTRTLTPIDYTIQTSSDRRDWKIAKTVVNGNARKELEPVEERFDPIVARYVRMNISSTESNDSPAIAEFEVIEDRFSAIGRFEVLQFTKNPFDGAIDYENFLEIYNRLSNVVEVSATISSNKGTFKSAARTPVILDNKVHAYSLILPAYGTKLDEVILSLDLPVKMKVYSASLTSLTLEELGQSGMIREYKEN